MCSVSFRKWGFWKVDVSLAMLRKGFATVYRGRGAEYGKLKDAYMKAEQVAKQKKIGMWKQLASGKYESPGEYKLRMKGSQ